MPFNLDAKYARGQLIPSQTEDPLSIYLLQLWACLVGNSLTGHVVHGWMIT